MSVFDFRGEVVRIKVKLSKPEEDPVYKKFAVDPHITTFEVLQRHIARAFDLKCDFSISYLATDDYGEQIYLSMLSDWDLDAAFLTSGTPTLRLKVEARPNEEDHRVRPFCYIYQSFEDDDQGVECLDDWDIIVPGDIPSRSRSIGCPVRSPTPPPAIPPPLSPPDFGVRGSRSPSGPGTTVPTAGSSNSLLSQLSYQMERTVSSVQRALQFRTTREQVRPKKPPMTDQEFKNFQDSIGTIVQPEEFRQSVFLGGLEPSLRKVAWRILLGVFPDRLNGSERLAFLQARADHYEALKAKWQVLLKEGKLPARSVALISNIKRDVLRTDRGLEFYNDATEAGQRHLVQLCELLCTFAFGHPSIGYVQGMSDMASPMLVVQEDEAAAYLCFCGLMERLAANFVDDQVVQRKFEQMRHLLSHLDPSIACYFQHNESHAYMGTMFRWLLLELKREFDFPDTLRVLEMQWAAVPAKPRLAGVRLTGADFDAKDLGDAATASLNPKDSLYLRLCLAASSGAAANTGGSQANACSAPKEVKPNGAVLPDLPPPGELGLGNPFLLFLCVSLLVEYREALLCADNEDSFLSVFFRKLGRRHNVVSVVNRAADLYAAYLREQRGTDEFPMIEMSL